MEIRQTEKTYSKFTTFVSNHPGVTISIAAILITLSLYAYFLGVLDRFQLEPSLFPLSIERAYQLGIAFLVRTDWLVLLVALFIIVIAFTTIFSLIFYGILFLTNKLQQKISKTFPNLANKPSPLPFTETMALSFFVFVAVLISLVMFYHLGKYKSVNREVVDYSSTIKMKGNDGALYKNAALILCGEFCAIHIKDDSKSSEATIILLPASEIEYIKQELTDGKK